MSVVPEDVLAYLRGIDTTVPGMLDFLQFSWFLSAFRIPFEPYLYDRTMATGAHFGKGWYETPEFAASEAALREILSVLGELSVTCSKPIVSSRPVWFDADGHWYHVDASLLEIVMAPVETSERAAIARRVQRALYLSLPTDYGWPYMHEPYRLEGRAEHTARCANRILAAGVCDSWTVAMLLEAIYHFPAEADRTDQSDIYHRKAIEMAERVPDLDEQARSGSLISACEAYFTFLKHRGQVARAEALLQRIIDLYRVRGDDIPVDRSIRELYDEL